MLRYGSRVLVEERIFGRELTVAVLGQRWLPAVETVPAGKEFDYAAKYQAGAAEETCPAHITDAEMRAAGELALRVHRALGLEVYSRTDELEEMGLTVPQITKIFRSLHDRGFDVSPSVFTVSQGADELMRYFEGRGMV